MSEWDKGPQPEPAIAGDDRKDEKAGHDSDLENVPPEVGGDAGMPEEANDEGSAGDIGKGGGGRGGEGERAERADGQGEGEGGAIVAARVSVHSGHVPDGKKAELAEGGGQ
ncbi:hypothetical protein CALVIDRAFT_529410, partial [Calocera viscosa TUFC12733]